MSAQAAPGSQAATPTQAAPVKEKKICRAEAATGSIMVKRTCHTRAEWDALAAANRTAFGDMRSEQQTSRTTSGMQNN